MENDSPKGYGGTDSFGHTWIYYTYDNGNSAIYDTVNEKLYLNISQEDIDDFADDIGTINGKSYKGEDFYDIDDLMKNSNKKIAKAFAQVKESFFKSMMN